MRRHITNTKKIPSTNPAETTKSCQSYDNLRQLVKQEAPIDKCYRFLHSLPRYMKDNNVNVESVERYGVIDCGSHYINKKFTNKLIHYLTKQTNEEIKRKIVICENLPIHLTRHMMKLV